MDAISFPRAFPDIPVLGLKFIIMPGVILTPFRSGRKITIDIASPTIAAEYRSSKLEHAEYRELSAWCASVQRGGSFLGYDINRQYPLAYKDGWPDFGLSPAFDGTCTLSTVETDMVRCRLAGLPASVFVLSPGDWLSYIDLSGIYRAHMVVAGGTSSALGNLDVQVEPPIQDGWGPSPIATVDLYQAVAEFKITPGSYDETHDDAGNFQISFKAEQTLAPPES